MSLVTLLIRTLKLFLHCLLTFNVVDGKRDTRLVILLQVTVFISQEKFQNLLFILSNLNFHNDVSWDVSSFIVPGTHCSLIANFSTGKSLCICDSVLHSIFFVLSFWNSGFLLSLDYVSFIALSYFLANFSSLSSKVSITSFSSNILAPTGSVPQTVPCFPYCSNWKKVTM